MANLVAGETAIDAIRDRERPRARLASALSVAAPVALLVIALSAFSPALVTQDFWLALTSGREIAEHGLPHVDHLTVMAYGHRWIDQQWLAQLALYEVARVSGVGAAAALCLFAIAAALSIAGLTAYGRGASPPAILAFLVASIAAGPWGLQLRPQALALPLFALTLWLLARDPLAVRTSTLFVLPVLCLWANLHGSVVLGVALVLVYGIQALLRTTNRVSRLRALACVLLSPLALIASPYATSLPSYYRLMLVDPPFGRAIEEWHRTTPSALNAVFFSLLAVAMVLVATRRGRLGLFDLFVLALTLATALDAIRGIVWFALACAALLPALATRGPGSARFEGPAAEALTWTAVAATLAAVAWLAVRPATSYTGHLSPRVVDVIRARTASNHERVLADDADADLLLWQLPFLRGRIAYDVRFELLTRRQIARLVDWSKLVPGSQTVAADYSLVIAEPKQVTALVASGKWRRVAASPRVDVAARRGAQTRGRRKPDNPTG